MWLLEYCNSWWLEWNLIPLAYFKTKEEAEEQLNIIKESLENELGNINHLEFNITEVVVSPISHSVSYEKGGDNNFYIVLK